jgi:hypothetical protein
VFESYVAGFLDADGSVSLGKDRKGEEYSRRPLVTFYNCDTNILNKIQERWGGRIKARLPQNQNSNVSYELELNAMESLSLLTDVVPYMLHEKKKKRASLIVEHYKDCTPRNGKYTTDQMEKKKWLVEQVMGTIMRGPGAYSN